MFVIIILKTAFKTYCKVFEHEYYYINGDYLATFETHLTRLEEQVSFFRKLELHLGNMLSVSIHVR